MSKRGQYFTIDAFAAMLVIATGVILVFAVSTFQPSGSQQQVLSQQLANTLAQSKVKELNNPFITQQVKGGNITDTDNTVLEQAYEFKRYFDSDSGGYNPGTKSNLSAELLESAAAGLVERQFKYAIYLDGDFIHGRGSGEATSSRLVSSKRIIFGAVNRSAEFWGPVTAEVRIWQ